MSQKPLSGRGLSLDPSRSLEGADFHGGIARQRAQIAANQAGQAVFSKSGEEGAPPSWSLG